jgi:ABC-type polysaccharide/polyol phosphate transport system ATPase subunit
MANAIEVKNLSVSYRMVQPVSIRGLFKKVSRNTRFQALNNISFTVRQGEILGVVGRNGGGKSTLLRTLGGIFSPDKGSIDLCNNSITLLAIGVGFVPDLTGRTNIFLSGLLMGFSKEIIEERIEEIIEFSELGSFIDKPVKTYSSGMYSKLAFSITAILETDIMMVDEVLSVGDIHFKHKSYKKMESLITDERRTAIIVSHEMATIRKLCDRVLWIDAGEIKQLGPTEEVWGEYVKFMGGKAV